MENDVITTELKYIRRDLDTIIKEVGEVKESVQSGYISKEVFETRVGRIEKLVYGMVAVLLTSFILALVALVFRK